jgi:hypothetical protein
MHPVVVLGLDPRGEQRVQLEQRSCVREPTLGDLGSR